VVKGRLELPKLLMTQWALWQVDFFARHFQLPQALLAHQEKDLLLGYLPHDLKPRYLHIPVWPPPNGTRPEATHHRHVEHHRHQPHKPKLLPHPPVPLDLGQDPRPLDQP